MSQENQQDEQQQSEASASNSGNPVLDCYLHNVTEVRKATSSNKRYFNCIVQSILHCAELKTVATAKSPIKMKNFRQQNDDDLIITKWTNITPLNQDKISFPYSEDLAASTSGQPISLSAIHNLAGEQLISIKGQTTSISGVKIITTQFSGKTKKQELIVRDNTAWVKVVLWGNHVDSLQLNKTYIFKNLRVKVTKYERYLNTPRNDEFTATECEEFTTPLVPVEEDVNTMSTFHGRILGIQTATKSLVCLGCNKKSVEVAGNKAVCQSCGLSQSAKACATCWLARVLVRPDDSSRNLRLVLPNEMIERFISITGSTVKLPEVTEEGLDLSILDSSSKKFKITFDNINYMVTDISVSQD